MTMSASYSGAPPILMALFGCLLFASNDVFFVSAYSQHRPSMPMPTPTAPTSSTSTPDIVQRRGFFTKTITAAATIMATVVTTPDEATADEAATAGVISSKYCAYGEGNDCDDLAEGNPYILELQRKSAANKENNVDSAKNAFYAKNYPDWFATLGKTMIQKESDGTFIVVDDAELAKLRAENKISVKTARAMGGRVADMTQKPMLVLKE